MQGSSVGNLIIDHLQNAGINWLIIGQQTPHNQLTEPNASWIAEIIEAADKVKIPVFLKNNLKPILPAIYPFVTNPLRDAEFKLRQEFPPSVSLPLERKRE
jgi:hypothetical protein